MTTITNLYEFLGVPRDASTEQINKVFREKALVLHPDKNRSDPDAAKKFKILMQAYQILTDQVRREKYDATLPAYEPEEATESDLATLWQTTAQRFFDQSDRYSPAIDALRLSHPLVLDGEDMLVVGIDHEQANLIGYLSVSITHNQIRRILSELYGKPLDFRLISGLTLDEWHEVAASEEKSKERRANAQKPLPPAQQPAPHPVAPPSPKVTVQERPHSPNMANSVWDEVMHSLTCMWDETESRTHALAHARYVFEVLPVIARGEDMTRSGGMSDEEIQRHLERAFDRASNLSSIAIGIIALEYLRFRTHLVRGAR